MSNFGKKCVTERETTNARFLDCVGGRPSPISLVLLLLYHYIFLPLFCIPYNHHPWVPLRPPLVPLPNPLASLSNVVLLVMQLRERLHCLRDILICIFIWTPPTCRLICKQKGDAASGKTVLLEIPLSVFSLDKQLMRCLQINLQVEEKVARWSSWLLFSCKQLSRCNQHRQIHNYFLWFFPLSYAFIFTKHI